VKKMVYPMEDGLQLEVEEEWDDMVLPDLSYVYPRLVETFELLAKGHGRSRFKTSGGEWQSSLEAGLPEGDYLRLASTIAETCPTAPAFVRDAPGLEHLARRLCRIADWARIDRKRIRALVKRKAMEAMTRCAQHAGSVEVAMGSISAQLGLRAQLVRVEARALRAEAEVAKLLGDIDTMKEKLKAAEDTDKKYDEIKKGIENLSKRQDGIYYEEEKQRNVALACERLHRRLTDGEKKIAPSSWQGEQAARAVLDEMRAEGRLLPYIQERRLLDLYGKWKREKELE